MIGGRPIMQSKKVIIAFATLIALMFAFAPAASAHKTAYTPDGKIKIVWGFLNEPAVTWTKTGLDLRISDNVTGAPILGAADTMEVHFRIGDEEMHFEDLAAQFGTPGAYTQVVTLTQPGLYSIVIHGTINGTTVDDMMISAAHEVNGVDETFFPKPSENPFETGNPSALSTEVAALKARIDALEAKIKTQSQTPATVTPQPSVSGSAPAPGLGMIALAAAIVGAALILRRK